MTTYRRLNPARGEIPYTDTWQTVDRAHVHEWEKGAHMREAFGVDGRRLACAICGVRKP